MLVMSKELVRSLYFILVVFFVLFGLTACVDLEEILFSGKNRFESDVPYYASAEESSNSNGGYFSNGSSKSVSAGTDDGEVQSQDMEEPANAAVSDGLETAEPFNEFSDEAGYISAERAIQEADMIQVDGDRLFALSNWAGLTIVDISTRDQFRVLGRFRNIQNAEPFEMYIRQDVVMVMFSSWGQYIRDEDNSENVYVATSKLLALDVSDPGNIEQVGSFDIPGSISDSRMVGDVVYVVGYQNGYCYLCEQNQPLTSVVSLDIADPRQIEKVDELRYLDDDNEWGWNRRSISVTTERLYVAGIEYGENGPVGSTIKVVDISDPSGDLVEGADIQAAGQITSRWQMDEYNGILRVISQPPQWNLTEPPVVQTFRILSSQEVEPLGKAELKLPRPEQLQSVRFDGTRAYAITYERVDPLFTIDLSDPAQPVQSGELEMPGWLYHMEPRGDRLIGLGFDDESGLGAIAVSLFDVSDLSQPQLLQRVNFGGDWAWLPEDQDRIHKVFRIFDDIGLMLVPYSGSSYSEACYAETSGVQLIDFTEDRLELRGNAASNDQPRRALLHDSRLLTVSDQYVRAFDIDNRDNPVQTASLALAQNVVRMEPLSDGIVARINQDYWTGLPTIDLVSQTEVDRPESSLSTIDIIDALQMGSECNSYVSIQTTFVEGDVLFLLYQYYRYTEEFYTYVMGVISIDTGDPSNPQILSNVEWELGENWWTEGVSDSYVIRMPSSRAVRTRNAIVTLEASYYDSRTGQSYATPRRRFRIVDISDPSQLKERTMTTPTADSFSAIVGEGDLLLTSRSTSVDDKPGVVRFYLDRIDLTDPSNPQRLLPVNVPGSLLQYDTETSRALTSDLERIETFETTYEECGARFSYFTFEVDESDYEDEVDFEDEADMKDESGVEGKADVQESPKGMCTGYRVQVHLLSIQDDNATLLDSYQLAEDKNISAWTAGDGMLFATLGGPAPFGWGPIAISGPTPIRLMSPFLPISTEQSPQQYVVLSGLNEDSLEVTIREIDEPDWSGWSWFPQLYASGKLAIVVGTAELAVIDANDPENPTVQIVGGYSGYLNHLAISSDGVLLSLGTSGAEFIVLSDNSGN